MPPDDFPLLAGLLRSTLDGQVDLANQIEKQLLDVGGSLGRPLHKGIAPLGSKVLGIVLRHYALVLKIALVSNQDGRKVVRVLDANNLVSNVVQIGKGRLGHNRE